VRRWRSDGHPGPDGVQVLASPRLTSSPESILEAKRRAARAGLTNVEFRQADIFALRFDAESFDHVFRLFLSLSTSRKPVEGLGYSQRPAQARRHHHRHRGRSRIGPYFYPESSAARAAIQCQIELQRKAGGNATRGPATLPNDDRGGVSARSVFLPGWSM